MKIGLRDLEYFVVLAEHRHVGRAAEALGLSQPALSRSLRRLERAMDTMLVTRTPKGVEVTTVGAAFLSRVEKLQLSVHDIAREVEDLTKGRAGELRVGANSIAVEHLLPAAMSNVFRIAPKLEIKIVVGSNDTLIPGLRSGRLDVVVSGAAASDPDLSHVHLWDDEYHVYAGAKHRLVSRKQLHIADVAAEKWAMPPDAPPTLWLRQTFQDHGFSPPRVMLETTALSLRLKAIASSDLLDFLPEVAAREAMLAGLAVKLHVKDLSWSRPLVASYRTHGYLSPAARMFIDILKAASNPRPRHSIR